jgi:hypothetical protein
MSASATIVQQFVMFNNQDMHHMFAYSTPLHHMLAFFIMKAQKPDFELTKPSTG